MRSFFYNRLIYLILFCLVFLSLFVRIYKVTSIPAGFFCDEAQIGYDADNLLTSGKDQHNKRWPFFFQSDNSYRTPIPIYSNLISGAVLGISEYSIRFTTALYGALTVLFIFFLGRKLGSAKIGIFAAFFLAISPWHIQMSRWGSEYNYFPLFFVLGLWIFLVALDKPKYLLFSYLLFGFGLYTYYPAWLIIPLFVVFLSGYWLISKRLSAIKYLLLGFLVFFIISSPLIIGLKEGYALSRWKTIQTEQKTFKQRVFNSLHYYIDHFSLQFLFLSGDIGYPGHFINRHSVRGFGELYKIQLPLLLLSIIFIFKKRKGWVLVFLSLIIFPLGSTFTNDGPFATRSNLGVIPFSLMSGLSLAEIYSERKKFVFRLLLVLTFLILLYESSIYFMAYYKDYPKYSSDFWGWQQGPKEILNYYLKVSPFYDELYLTGEFNGPQVFIPFYTKNSCPKCHLGWLDNYKSEKKQLFSTSPGLLEQSSFKEKFVVKKRFYYPSGTISFLIGEIK